MQDVSLDPRFQFQRQHHLQRKKQLIRTKYTQADSVISRWFGCKACPTCYAECELVSKRCPNVVLEKQQMVNKIQFPQLFQNCNSCKSI